MTKITFLTDGIWPASVGGMQIYAFNLVKALVQQGIYIDLYIPVGQLESVSRELDDVEKRYVSFYEINFPHFRFPCHYLVESYLYSRNIFRLLQKVDRPPSFVYCHGFSGWYLLRRKGKLNAKVSVHFHGYEMYQQQYSLKELASSWLFKIAVKDNLIRADIIFSLGGGVTELIKKILHTPHKIVELPVGVFPGRIAALPSKVNIVREFVFVGRFEKRKGLENLIAALKMIDNRKFVFHFVGPIPDRLRIRNSKYHYYGLIRDREHIYRILDRADFLVLPSLSEGMPTVITEAMSRGLAIIATSVGAVSELVDENNGFLVSPNDIDALAKALVKGIEVDDKNLQKLKSTSLVKITHYKWPKIANRLLTCIIKNSARV